MDMNLSKLQEVVEDRGAWHATVHGITESDTTQWLKNNNNKLRDEGKSVFLSLAALSSTSFYENGNVLFLLCPAWVHVTTEYLKAASEIKNLNFYIYVVLINFN